MGKTRNHAPPSDFASAAAPRDLAKQELARRLSKLIQDRDWTQSDLARAAGLPRELISSYVRGKSFPEPKSLRRIADALLVKVEELAPAAQGMAASDEIPSFSVTEFAGHPGKVWLRINRLVTMDSALKIGAILEAQGGQ